MSPSTPFNVIYIGAGTINFGGPVQPWNHSIRIEKKLGSRLNVVGIVDIYPQAAHKVIAKKREEKVGGYEETLVFESIQDAGIVLQGDKVPHLAVIGTHPWTRGSTKPGSDAEIQLVAAWPKIGMHIEKPLSSSSVEEVMKVVQKLEEAGTVTSVGYMLSGKRDEEDHRRKQPYYHGDRCEVFDGIEIPIGEDDCYLNELSALIDVIDGIASRDVIQSPYEDAVKSYKLTWDIRLQGEATERARGIIHPPLDASS
ncbi:hypothetical protein M231_05403 [Tremella mesenterica]|uniref:Gfo/Idh/MocA-like oxidoreductase N-terminal domain-containing protein n=1 Tax=Tremella mesenterica TaxID=5217 RepID=A0A4V1M3M0_TREME|nr:hypothetical protein M231_05403 [Tremella mesenterica]